MIRSDQVSDLYASPNGDRWLLGRRLSGELVVCHGSGDSVVHERPAAALGFSVLVVETFSTSFDIEKKSVSEFKCAGH
jgi:hypothetical protein